MPSSWVSTECSIHQVQHTPKIVCRPFIFTIWSWPLNVASSSGVPTSQSTATSQFSIRASKVKSACRIPTVASELTDELSPGAPSIDRLQVLVQSRSITACKWISKYTRLLPPSASPKSLDQGLGVYLWVHSIVIFRRTSNCSQALPTASPDIACVDQ